MVVTGCSVVTGDGHHRVTIIVDVVPVIGPDVYVVGVWVDACASDADGCVPSSDNVDMSGLVSLPLDAAGSFPIFADV